MAPYQVTIAYDGTDFFGFQRQKNHRTVQGEVEKALKCLNWDGRAITSSGRTDTGVHAEGQVINFILDWDHSEHELINAMNSYLPGDISVTKVEIVDETFNSRFSAKARQYRYQIVFLPSRNPIFDRFYWRVWPEPNKDLLKSGSKKLLGIHDFSSLGKPPIINGSPIRTVLLSEWTFLDGGKAIFRIKAESFLYHMVRRIVFLLIQIGQGKMEAIDLDGTLNRKKIMPAGIAPAHGLFLEKVIY
jgi:tRNA pseudouridine38-40 synthase